ncbi:MAG TPA: DUF1840 domain-containing protein [Burkholderiales bacterium]|nr:DUF1840 domain-containing protein [Burkholderiales bacterium]
MLVKFKSDAGDMTMFGDVGVTLLKMMGQTGALPGALLAKDVPAALERLKRGAAVAPATAAPGPEPERDDGPKVSLKQRAFPLVELLERCVKKNCDVIWEEEKPLFPGKASR